MCGIVGAAARGNVVPILVDGLRRLEYRGYDSAGVAVVQPGRVQVVRTVGRVEQLQRHLTAQPIAGFVGIAHTRWATHGKPSAENAHPISIADRVAIVHNGVIENYEQVYRQHLGSNYQRQSDTDTEVIAALVYKYLQEGKPLWQAVLLTTQLLVGGYAIALVDALQPENLVVARCGSPLVIGMGVAEYFVASDPLALQKLTQDFIYLEDGDVAVVSADQLTIYDQHGQPVERPIYEKKLSFEAEDKGKFRHFMQKEIFEQPRAINDTLAGRVYSNSVIDQIFGVQAPELFAKVERVQIVACGTSYYAGLLGRYWLEEFTGLACEVEVASEFRYRSRATVANTLFVTLSQSGETADTLAALRATIANAAYVARLSICNVPESSLVRESDLAFLTHAGPEVGVASSKGFTTQLVALWLLTMVLAKQHQQAAVVAPLLADIQQAASYVEMVLALEPQIVNIAKLLVNKQHVLFLGRGWGYPLALEGALKLKELSYIHAEAYPSGELKHGPLALVDENMPIVALINNDALLDKMRANLATVMARGGKVIAVTNGPILIEHAECLALPAMPSLVAPFAMAVVLQLLAYHVAVAKGTDVDRPRNLAKSVTVE